MSLFMRRLAAAAVVLAAAVLLQAGPARAQRNASADSLMGTWNMDLGKSTFDPQVQITRRFMVFTPADNGFHCVITTFNQNLEAQTSEYTAALDGKEWPTPDLAVATVSFTQVDANTIQRIGKRNGQQTETYTMKFSNGGKTLTIAVKGTDPTGMDYSSSQVYTKQP